MPLTDEELDERLERIQRMAQEISDGIGRALRESDRRRAEYLPVLRRAGIVPSHDVPPRRRSRWWW